jgi:HNH endonuclease/NUMOD4 motif
MADSHDTLRQESEEWRPIPGYEGIFSVSSLGRVRRDTGKILTSVLYPKGYLCVCLRREGIQKNPLVHRLVAAAFLGPCPDGYEVNHLDGAKRNNRADNLEYCTPKQNNQHAARIGLKAKGDRHGSRKHPERWARGERNGCAKLTAELVKELRRRHAAGESSRSLAKIYSIAETTVSKVLRGETWKHVT